MTPEQKEKLRNLPAISHLLEHDTVRKWMGRFPRAVVVDAMQSAVDLVRSRLIGDEDNATETANTREEVLAIAEQQLENTNLPSLRPVINATGVVLHTGLGRAPLCTEAVKAVAGCAGGYSNLELNLETGTRGHRPVHVSRLLAELTGAESATVVNNNAAATLLILNTLAKGSEVIVSRGELVEIGGSYRLPEMMSASGAILREVGTTNRTRISDYQRAINDNTAALMRVHTSNYKVVGFTENTSIEELVETGRKNNKLVIDDLGSGALFDLSEFGLPKEPDVRTSIKAGADLVCFSGDKILGGPQAGVIAGRADLIKRIESNPLMRTYRVDKMTLAGLEATLRQYRDVKHAVGEIPSLALMCTPPAELQKRAKKLCKLLSAALSDDEFEVITDNSVAGGGSLPGREMETRCVSWLPKSGSIDETLSVLRQGTVPVIARAKNERILFDVRTLKPEELPALASACAKRGRS